MLTELLPTAIFEDISADFCAHNGKSLRTDFLIGLKQCQFHVCLLAKSSTLFAVRCCFVCLGVPVHLHTNSAPPFGSHVLSHIPTHWSVQHVTSTPHNLQGNGHAKAVIKKMKSHICKTALYSDLELAEYITGLQKLCNTADANGQLPAQRLVGQPFCNLVPAHHKLLK